MTSRLSKYPVPSTIRSSLVRNPPEAIPSLDELEQLHVELKALRQNSVDRAKKAGEDLRTIEESMQRMKAKEKGKARVHDKVKRERDCASTLPGCVLLIFIRLHISPGRPQPLYLINTFGVEFYIAMIDHSFRHYNGQCCCEKRGTNSERHNQLSLRYLATDRPSQRLPWHEQTHPH